MGITVRQVRPTDRDALKSFFLGLSNETVFLLNHFDTRDGVLNTEITAQTTADRLTSEIVVYPDETRWVATEARVGTTLDTTTGFPKTWDEITGLSWLSYVPYKPTLKYTARLGILVADAWQGKGIGTTLMMEMIEWARDSGYRKICLNPYNDNKRAVGLYEKFGFKLDGFFTAQEWDKEKPLDVVSMSLFL